MIALLSLFRQRLCRHSAAGTAALRFVMIGAALFGLVRLAPAVPALLGGAQRPPIVLSAEDVAALRREWTAEHGSSPDSAEQRRLIDGAVDDEILQREALALGLDRSDRLVRSRLAGMASFLQLADSSDTAALDDAAHGIDLQRSDPIVRRHLGHLMRLALAHVGRADFPSEADLARYYDRHRDDFSQPARLMITQVYLRPEHAGGARELLEQLRVATTDSRAASDLGDPFLAGSRIGPAPTTELARRFGAAFAAALKDAPLHTWLGPIRSPYGVHLVRIDARIAPSAPPLAAVRSRVLQQLLRERGAALLQKRLAALRKRYRVEVDDRS